ncbi:hypothetical protein DFA_03723 [Cavenderia fasciculata]|uniref:Uncharacterized protein n=1 Tax=Cavenderia fasciculata TaxID=261658 RepID=F4Q085_CACFS|nr:uncharacterized protein DFA_03723 [Cavenderia fasciculata]EGG18236.1 hypothetical protein DFA_03723 [Cavenderia fasciculata]|eukprot:XP_004357059.1 hypothetical protein DFA_03723 [Cavenderia fasciculata]
MKEKVKKEWNKAIWEVVFNGLILKERFINYDQGGFMRLTPSGYLAGRELYFEVNPPPQPPALLENGKRNVLDVVLIVDPRSLWLLKTYPMFPQYETRLLPNSIDFMWIGIVQCLNNTTLEFVMEAVIQVQESKDVMSELRNPHYLPDLCYVPVKDKTLIITGSDRGSKFDTFRDNMTKNKGVHIIESLEILGVLSSLKTIDSGIRDGDIAVYLSKLTYDEFIKECLNSIPRARYAGHVLGFPSKPVDMDANK